MSLGTKSLNLSPKPKLGDLLPNVLGRSTVKSVGVVIEILLNLRPFPKVNFWCEVLKFTVSCEITEQPSLELYIMLIKNLI